MILSTRNVSGYGSGSAIGCDMPLILSFENGSGNGSGSAIGCDMPLILSVDRSRSVLPTVVVLDRPILAGARLIIAEGDGIDIDARGRD